MLSTGKALSELQYVIRSARAKMRTLIKRLLKKHKYPPEGMDDVVQTVMTQCELWTDNVMDTSNTMLILSRLYNYKNTLQRKMYLCRWKKKHIIRKCTDADFDLPGDESI